MSTPFFPRSDFRLEPTPRDRVTGPRGGGRYHGRGNTSVAFQCTCPAGTVLNDRSQACEDVDECDELGPNACVAGRCLNTVGSFECECPPGTVLDSSGRVCLGEHRNTPRRGGGLVFAAIHI